MNTETMIKALRILAQDIQSDDGVANACIADAADMIEALRAENEALKAEQYKSDVDFLLKALFYAPSSPVSVKKAEEIKTWYEKVKKLSQAVREALAYARSECDWAENTFYKTVAFSRACEDYADKLESQVGKE